MVDMILSCQMDSKLEFYIWKNGRRQGPFSAAALAGSIRLGSIPPETPVWTETDPTWRSAAEVSRLFDAQRAGRPPIASRNSALVTAKPVQEREEFNPRDSSGKDTGLKIALAVTGFAAIALIILFSKQSPGDPTPPSSGNAEAEHIVTVTPNKAVEPSSPGQHPTKIVRRAVTIDEAEKCVVMARGSKVAGTAFIAMDAGLCHVYTNVHVASCASLEFIDFRGRKLNVARHGRVVGMSGHRNEEPGVDIVRFPLMESPDFALGFASRETIEQRPAVWTLGDSGGESVLKTLRGRITGVGPAKIEVDCEFIQGNSGGPIVTSLGEVVGIASYMKADHSIWAKGTKQEIRRMAWIPGRDHHWIETSLDQLAGERELVESCHLTSGLLWLILCLLPTEDGFRIPDDISDEAGEILVMAAGHPLRKSLGELNDSLAMRVRDGTASHLVQHREYVRFFDSCASFQRDQLRKAERKVRSSFWNNELNRMLDSHTELLDYFQMQIMNFRDSARIGLALSDA